MYALSTRDSGRLIVVLALRVSMAFGVSEA